MIPIGINNTTGNKAQTTTKKILDIGTLDLKKKENNLIIIIRAKRNKVEKANRINVESKGFQAK